MSNSNFLACRTQVRTTLPVQPVGAGVDAFTTPAFLFIELADQLQQLKSGRVDVRCELGDFFAEAFEVAEMLGVRVVVQGGDGVRVGHGYLL